MSLPFDHDPHGGHALAHLAEQLPPPLSGGARRLTLTPGPAGVVAIDEPIREPVVLVVLTRALGPESIVVTVRVGTLTPDVVLRFEPWSAQGTALLVFRPEVDEVGFAAPFALTLAALRRDVRAPGDDTLAPTVLDDQALAADLRVEVVSGVLGRLLYVMHAEKAKLRRQAREIRAVRRLDHARDDALDRLGRAHGVARFDAALTWDAGLGEVSLTPGRESDESYRRRLRLFEHRLPRTARTLLTLLNGPGEGPANDGPLSETGLTARFVLEERDNPWRIAFKLVSQGGMQARQRLATALRHTRMVQPGVPLGVTERMWPPARVDDENALRARLDAAWEFPPGARIVPALARALDLLGRVRAALGDGTRHPVLQAFEVTAGPRYTLGLGVDLAPLDTAQVDALRGVLDAGGASTAADPNPAELLALLERMTAVLSDDPLVWLYAPCGLKTVHALAPDRVYVSHLPTAGLVVEGPDSVAPGVAQTFSAHLEAPDDPNLHATLVHALQAAREAQPEALPLASDAKATWAAGTVAGGGLRVALQAAGLQVVTAPAVFAQQLALRPERSHLTVALSQVLSDELRAGDAGATQRLRTLVRMLADHGVAAIAPVVPAAHRALSLVIATAALPSVGTNVSQRRSAGYRWYVLPLTGAGEITRTGEQATYRATRPGLVVLAVVAYQRVGATDPYEIRVDLPPDATLDLAQYEWVMNALDHLHPVGIQVDTSRLRLAHVAPQGDAVVPFDFSLARTFRAYRTPRIRVQEGQGPSKRSS